MVAGHEIGVVSDREELVGRRIALVSVSVGIALSLAKILVGLHAGSAAVVSDGLEAAGDVLSSVIVYAGLWIASKPPDEDHPYGHGRYETLAGLAVGAMLLLTGAAILWHGISIARDSEPVAAYALYPLIASVFIKIVLAALKLRVGKTIQSTSLQADAWHDITDLISTAVALTAVVLSLANPARFALSDRIGAIIIGLIIISLAVRLVRNTVDQLVDTMPAAGKLAEIREVAMSVPGTLGIEKCFARRTGLKYHVDLHLEVDPNMTVRESHEIATRVRFSIKENLHWIADVLVHVEPSPLVSRPPRRMLGLKWKKNAK